VPLGVLEKNDVLLGSAMLVGRERDRLDRRNDVNEKRRFFLSSLGLSVSAEKLLVVFSGVAIREDVGKNSGSSEASREEGIESDRRCGPYTSHCDISMCPKVRRHCEADSF
jgi:hypothetical protein